MESQTNAAKAEKKLKKRKRAVCFAQRLFFEASATENACDTCGHPFSIHDQTQGTTTLTMHMVIQIYLEQSEITRTVITASTV